MEEEGEEGGFPLQDGGDLRGRILREGRSGGKRGRE